MSNKNANVSDTPKPYWWLVIPCPVNREYHPDLIGKYISPEMAEELCPIGVQMVEPGKNQY